MDYSHSYYILEKKLISENLDENEFKTNGLTYWAAYI